MTSKRLARSLTERSSFVVVAELAAGPGFNFSPIEKFLKAAQEAGADAVPKGFDFVGVTVPQSPGGVANLEPGDVLARVKAMGLLGSLDFIPHVSCKDHNADAITGSLMSHRAQGVESVLALTGDKPVRSKGVFEVESAGLLQLIQRLNDAACLKAGPGQWQDVPQFFPGAAVSPFKYTEASQMQQYYKMEKKIACGAKFLITQLGYDWRKSLELVLYLRENGIEVPVLGNVYLLTTATPAPRLMHDGKLPGCFVSDELLATLQRESPAQHIERAAQQVAMYKALGVAGVDIGGVPDFETFRKILDLASQIGENWEKYKENLCWSGGEHFYLYDEKGQRTPGGGYRQTVGQRGFNLTHRLLMDPAHAGFKLGRGFLNLVGAGKGKGFAYRSFATAERAIKYAAFDCQDCGDCYLPENFSHCTLGGCEKGLSNAPCGDATVDGRCGNNLERVCVGEWVYQAAAAERGGVQRLRETVNKPRDPRLQHTSSVLNYLFGRDHTRRPPLIPIGDLIHASDPKIGKVMKEILDLGPDGFTRQPGPVSYIGALIRSQVEDGADYIGLNIDALNEDEHLAAQMMRQYVRLVHRWGRGVPVCIDSRFGAVLAAGLAEWHAADPSARTPLICSVRLDAIEKVMSLRNERDFSLVIPLEAPGVDEAFGLAGHCFDHAVREHGFGPEQMFFSPAVVPLVKDGPVPPGGFSRTRIAFETMRRIKADRLLRRSHCLLRTSDAVAELPGRAVGVCRAFVGRAMESGMDAAFANPASRYGESPADSSLLELVDAHARIDGSPERVREAQEAMAKFCAGCAKPRRASAPPASIKAAPRPDGTPADRGASQAAAR